MEQVRVRRGNSKIAGERGEEIVAGFLERCGYVVVVQNWRCRHLEIDIIAVKGDTVHFVEVKLLSSNKVAEPYEKVGQIKRSRIIDAANGFLNSRRWYSFLCRFGLSSNFEVSFDVASVVGCGDSFTVDFFENAYSPLW